MSIGMSYTEYWYDDPYLVVDYKKANDYRTKQKNAELWLQGAYIYNALTVVMGNAFSKNSTLKYPAEPYEVVAKSKVEEELDSEKEKQKVIDYFTRLKKNWDIQNKE